MGELTYGIMYNPEVAVSTSINYVCSDNKIHVRFRDYKKEEVISGFEQKLTYLFTYLLNYSECSNLISDEYLKLDTIWSQFEASHDVNKIRNVIKYVKGINFKGFRLFPNYKKCETYNLFGEVSEDAFPVITEANTNIKYGDLNHFLEKFKINIVEYLFNDGYSVVISKKSKKDVNKKFINKENRKASNEVETDFVKLW